MDVKSKNMVHMFVAVAVVSVCGVRLLWNVAAQVFCRLSDNCKIGEEKKNDRKKTGSSIQVFHLCNTQFFCFKRTPSPQPTPPPPPPHCTPNMKLN